MPEKDVRLLSQLGLKTDWLSGLTGSSWKGIDCQGGKVNRQSQQWPATFRVSGLVVRAEVDVLISATSVDLPEEEWFFLEIESIHCPGSMTVLGGARPPFLPIQKWPPTTTPSPSLLSDEHRRIEVGVAISQNSRFTDVSRLMWIAARSRDEMLFIFADAEIPWDVFVTTSEQTVTSARKVLSTRAMDAGFTCRHFTFGGG